jgi:septal ring factor EnvC (AmiA/AmiB activator)
MRARLAALLGCAALCGCQTTGDPNQGGLFGWSEKKARQRIAEREQTLGEDQAAMQTEQRHEAALRREVRANAEDLDEQQKEISQLLANVEALEQEAPTPAAASRARRLHREIDAVRENEALSVDERWTLLRQYSAEVDLMRAEVAGPDAPAGR